MPDTQPHQHTQMCDLTGTAHVRFTPHPRAREVLTACMPEPGVDLSEEWLAVFEKAPRPPPSPPRAPGVAARRRGRILSSNNLGASLDPEDAPHPKSKDLLEQNLRHSRFLVCGIGAECGMKWPLARRSAIATSAMLCCAAIQDSNHMDVVGTNAERAVIRIRYNGIMQIWADVAGIRCPLYYAGILAHRSQHPSDRAHASGSLQVKAYVFVALIDPSLHSGAAEARQHRRGLSGTHKWSGLASRCLSEVS